MTTSPSASSSDSSDSDELSHQESKTPNDGIHDVAGASKNDYAASSSSEDESSSSSSENEGELKKLSESDGESSSDEDMDVPLQDRIARDREKGRASLKDTRARKTRALKTAKERLSEGRSKPDPSPRKRSKHAPAEVSSKRRDFFRRGAFELNQSGIGVAIGANRYKPRDPRMSSLCGHLDEDHFERNYAFLQEMRDKEIEKLSRKIKAQETTGRKGQNMRRRLHAPVTSLQENKARLQELKNQKKEWEKRQVDRAAKRSVKKQLQKRVEEGKSGPYFLKRRERKKLELEAKLEEIRKRKGEGAVEKAILKRRKKSKSRDAAKLPSSRF